MKATRDQILVALQERDLSALSELAGRTPGVTTVLLQLLFEPDSLLHWRAVEGLGELARTHPKKIEKIISRLLWSLNEDSGSFGWGAGAALGEIGRGNYALVADIIEMFFAFLDEEFPRPAMLWGLGRLAQVHPEVVREGAERIMDLLGDPVPRVRAYAAWCLGTIKYGPAAEALARLAADEAPVSLYDAGELRRTSVGEVAREARQRLTAG